MTTSIIPSDHFWKSGFNFLIFAQPSEWQRIFESAIHIWKISPFDLFSIGDAGTVTIPEARELNREALKKPSQGILRLCVIYNMDHCTEEAANALLKILEAGPQTTRFLLFSHTRNVLPTIRSRCVQWYHQNLNIDLSTLIPFDESMNFGTVSLKISEICERGEAAKLVDSWIKTVLRSTRNTASALKWLIFCRYLITQTNVGAQALLETTYLYLKNDYPFPDNFDKLRHTTHHGNF